MVVLLTEYTASAADSRSPEALSIGSGDGWGLTEGRAVPVRWTREVAIARTTLVSEDGSPVTLTPGRTWVALPSDAGSTVELLDSEAAAHIRDQG